MSKDIKARIQLLDDNGTPIGEVDAIIDSSAILYTNENKTMKDIGKIPAGSSFDETPVKDILDAIIYDDISADVLSVEGSSFEGTITDSVDLVREMGDTVDPFSLTVNYRNGTSESLKIIVDRFENGQLKDSQNKTLTLGVGDSGSEVFTIDTIDNINTTLNVYIIDDKGATNKVQVNFKFTYPVFYGFLDPKILDEHDNLIIQNMDAIEEEIQRSIDEKYKWFKSSVTDSKEIQLFSVSKSYAKFLNPCIVFPTSWNKPIAITDGNGNNIISSFTYLTDIDINLPNHYNATYICYMMKQGFSTDSSFLSGITFHFEGSSISGVIGDDGAGVPVLSPYNVKGKFPLDSRFTVETYGDLLATEFPYQGLVTFVKEINTLFLYTNEDHWLPTSTKFWVVEDDADLTEEFGGWDDVALNTVTGTIHRKRYNNVWERWGEGHLCTSSITPVAPRYVFNAEYDDTKIYRYDKEFVDLVYHKGSTYICLKDGTMGIQPSDDKKNWSYFSKGFDL